MIVHAEQANASSLGKYDKLPFNSNAGVMDEMDDVMDEMGFPNSDAADAIALGNPDGLRDALARGADVNGRLYFEVDLQFHISLLGYAAKCDDHSCCMVLLAAGADVNFVDGHGATPLCLREKKMARQRRMLLSRVSETWVCY